MDDIVPESDISDDDTEAPKRSRTIEAAIPRKRHRSDLVHPSVWFRKPVVDALWVPGSTVGVQKPLRDMNRGPRHARSKKHKKRTRKKKKRGLYPKRPQRFVRSRVPEHLRLTELLFTSWFDVSSFADEDQASAWSDLAVATRSVETADVDSDEEVADNPVNSVVKLRLFSTPTQKSKLNQMFASNRAVYNKLVACSRDDRLGIGSGNKMKQKDLLKKYRPIAVLKSMSSLPRLFKKTLKSSRALYFNKKIRGENTTYLDIKFKSKFAPSSTIEIRERCITALVVNGENRVHFHPTFFGLKQNEGIALHEPLPDVTTSVRLQRFRDAEFYRIIPRFRDFPRTASKRVCSIDPGVRKFATVYDLNGRTLCVTDSHDVLKRKFEAIDVMKSTVAQMEIAANERVETKVRTKPKSGTEPRKSSEHRLRYRLRRRIRYTSRKVTRSVNDMHQKISSWLATHYECVLLPSFQTSEMVRRYTLEEAADATPSGVSPKVQKRKIRSPTARAMLAQAHYRFKQLLKYKLERAGGRMIECEAEYTSKTCSSCGDSNSNLGGSEVFRCPSCPAVFDRDLNAARNIFHKNMRLLV